MLLAAYRASARELEADHAIVPAAEWLLDNYHLVEEHVREIRDDLAPGYYRQLPKLAGGPFAGYPRVFELAWAFVAHTDSHFDPEMLRRFVCAYQSVQPLTIGELWAVPITLRIVLIENLRRLADQMTAGRLSRGDADAMADRVLVAGLSPDIAIARMATAPLPELFAAQFAKRLRDYDSASTPTLAWLEERLAGQDSSIDDVVLHAQQRLGASNVTVRNIVTSLRLISDIDWADLFESVSLVDARLREASHFAEMDFSTRNLYRGAVEELARGSTLTEIEIAEAALQVVVRRRACSERWRRRESTGRPGVFSDRRRPAVRWSARSSSGRPCTCVIRRFNAAPRHFRLCRQHRFGHVGVARSGVLGARRFGAGLAALLAIAAFIPASEVATAFVNRAVTWSYGAAKLPGLELKDGVPTSLRTLVAIPSLITGKKELLDQIEQLEIHHLSGAAGDLTFALLLDGLDADQEKVAGEDALLARGSGSDRPTERAASARTGRPEVPAAQSAAGSSTPPKANGWAGSANGASCTSSTGCCGVPTDTSFVTADGRRSRRARRRSLRHHP